MSDDLSGDIVIDDNAVRFSDNVGKYATNEQVAVLYRTAERLGKVAVDDRYPADPFQAHALEMVYKTNAASPISRNEYGVPNDSILDSMVRQLKYMGKL